jgi:hypothetical protein
MIDEFERLQSDQFNVTDIDNFFDLYDMEQEDFDGIKQNNLIQKKVYVEFNTYYNLLRIAEENNSSIEELLTYLYILYINEYKINNAT